MLEVTYEAIEDGIIDIEGTNTGVFIGAGFTDHAILTLSKSQNISSYAGPGCALSIIANRISYVFNLTGPSLVSDTACSSSATALSCALKYGRENECDMMIVGGINYMRSPGMAAAFSSLGVLSKDCCKPFCQNADGYIRSEGAGVIILKELTKAVKDKNKIYAVIKDTFVNQDGHNESLTMPNPLQQQSLLKRAYSKINKNDLIYMEMHGTGTPVGDPREAEAVSNIFNDRKEKLAIGSVKSNLGHMECASAIGSIIKCALMCYHNKLIPSKTYGPLSDKVNWNVLRLQTETKDINKDNYFIGINSFGFGGANAHIIMRNHKKFVKDDNTINSKMFVKPYIIGSNSKNSLIKLMGKYNATNISPYSTCIRSVGHKFISGIIEEKFSRFNPYDIVEVGAKRPLVFVYSGQGSQHPDMGRELYKSFSTFRKNIDLIDKLYHDFSGISFIQDINMFKGEKTEKSKQVYLIDYSLICLFAFQYSVSKLLDNFGIKPQIIVGHSVGELAGACFFWNGVSYRYY